jgi:hypothetical protein
VLVVVRAQLTEGSNLEIATLAVLKMTPIAMLAGLTASDPRQTKYSRSLRTGLYACAVSDTADNGSAKHQRLPAQKGMRATGWREQQ